MTLPGLWTSEIIRRSNWLPNAYPPQLRVTHVLKERRLLSVRFASDVPGPPPLGPQSDWIVNSNIFDEYEEDDVTLIEDREVLKWSIPVHNGVSVGHQVEHKVVL